MRLVLGTEGVPSVSLRADAADGKLAVGDGTSGQDGGRAARGPEDAAAAGFQEILDRYRTNGDNPGVGEAYASQLSTVEEADVERTFVNIVSRWASSSPVDVEINSIGDLLDNVDKFVNDLLALAVVHATLRMEEAERELPTRVGDVNYRIAESLRSLFGLTSEDESSSNHACGHDEDEGNAIGSRYGSGELLPVDGRGRQAAVYGHHQAGACVRAVCAPRGTTDPARCGSAARDAVPQVLRELRAVRGGTHPEARAGPTQPASTNARLAGRGPRPPTPEGGAGARGDAHFAVDRGRDAGERRDDDAVGADRGRDVQAGPGKGVPTR